MQSISYLLNRKLILTLAILLSFALVASVHAAREDCGDLPNVPQKPAEKVNKEDPNKQNDYDTMVEEDDRPGVTYLAMAHGDTPKANKCGLKPTNADAEWTGWGGPVGDENVTIGEGPGTRNEIVIGGTYFVRGLGSHAIARFVYDLTGDDYKKFEAYVGMSDEKDPAECNVGGSSDFTFKVDGKVMFKSDTLTGTEGGENVPAEKVEFDIPAGAQELEITIGDGGDGNCGDHAAMGDAKLENARALAVEPIDKLPTIWGKMKARY